MSAAKGDNLRRLVGRVESRQNAKAGMIAACLGVLRDGPAMPAECAPSLNRAIGHLRKFTEITANARLDGQEEAQ